MWDIPRNHYEKKSTDFKPKKSWFNDAATTGLVLNSFFAKLIWMLGKLCMRRCWLTKTLERAGLVRLELTAALDGMLRSENESVLATWSPLADDQLRSADTSAKFIDLYLLRYASHSSICLFKWNSVFLILLSTP